MHVCAMLTELKGLLKQKQKQNMKLGGVLWRGHWRIVDKEGL